MSDSAIHRPSRHDHRGWQRSRSGSHGARRSRLSRRGVCGGHDVTSSASSMILGGGIPSAVKMVRWHRVTSVRWRKVPAGPSNTSIRSSCGYLRRWCEVSREGSRRSSRFSPRRRWPRAFSTSPTPRRKLPVAGLPTIILANGDLVADADRLSRGLTGRGSGGCRTVAQQSRRTECRRVPRSRGRPVRAAHVTSRLDHGSAA